MNATVNSGTSTRDRSAPRESPFPDPLDHDMPGDERLLATRRALCRVATVAAEAGARFQRDGSGVDPMGWMLAPRRMFRGAAPIDACLERESFLRGVLVHGLSLDLDMDADEIDDLLDGEMDGLLAEVDAPVGGGAPAGTAALAVPPLASRGQRLFTATVVARHPFETVHAFHASLAEDEEEIAGRLYFRLGGASADAVIVDGFDPSAPMVEALVAPAIADTLAQVAADPLSPLAHGLDLNIEQRFLG